MEIAKKPHLLCVPFPFQSHINALLKVAKILHSKGFHITFVNTEFNHQKIQLSRGPDALKGLPDFRFETIPDGLPSSDLRSNQDVLPVIVSVTKNGAVHIQNLVAKLNKSPTDPPVSCIVADTNMTCAVEAGQELGIPQVLLWPMSAASFLCFFLAEQIVGKGLIPLQDKRLLTNGYLDEPVECILGVKELRRKDLPSSYWDGNHELGNILIELITKADKASAIIINTFDALDIEGLDAMKSLLPAVYTVGPLQLIEQQIQNKHLYSFGTNLLKEDEECLKWLDSKPSNSVVYVNFGSTTVMTKEQLVEFAWGLANCNHPFLWVIRPDLVIGETAILPAEFIQETADRSMISGWCPQEKVLLHPSTAIFLTHSGWNSIMDAICGGVPIINWPFFGDQQTNCRYSCVHWGIGQEIDKNVKRDDVEKLVRELMESDKGKEMKRRAMEWKKSAEESTSVGGSSCMNWDKIVRDVLVKKIAG